MATPYCTMKTEDLDETIEWFVSERRRYGRRIFCFVYYKVNGEDVEDGDAIDPWPAVNYPKSQLVWQVRAAGYGVMPSKADIQWAKRMQREERFFCMAPEDREAFLPPKSA